MEILRLDKHQVENYRALMKLFADEFDESETYNHHPPSDDYIINLLSKSEVIFLVAKKGQELVGGLVAYVLPKFEQQRSEVYIYDLAVMGSFRRQGIATSLINALKPVARAAGAWVIFVQADYVDPPAIALYKSLGEMEEVLHFDIPV